MRIKIALICCGMSAIVLLAFAEQQTTTGGIQLSRYGDLLRERNIKLTEPALVSALKSTDPTVRYLAAMKLAEDKAVGAIPAVEEALAREKVARSRVNIALALGLLGNKKRTIELRKACTDTDLVSEFRLYPVQYLFDLGVPSDEDCLKAAEGIVSSPSTTIGDRVTALGLLSRFEGLPYGDQQEVLRIVLNSLKDSEPVVLMAASQSLASLGNASAIPELQAALKREQDESVRSQYASDLDKLLARSRN